MNACGSSPKHLLLAYAAECGLKALILKERNLDSTEFLPEDASVGHDLRLALFLLHAPPNLTIRDTATQQRRPRGVHPKALHEAFRYAITVDAEAVIVGELNVVLQWVLERL